MCDFRIDRKFETVPCTNCRGGLPSCLHCYSGKVHRPTEGLVVNRQKTCTRRPHPVKDIFVSFADADLWAELRRFQILGDEEVYNLIATEIDRRFYL